MTRTLLASLLAATTLCSVSCSSGPDAKAIEQQIGGLPGVSSTRMDYHSYSTTGEQFDLTVNLLPEVTDQQAVQISRVFVDEAHRSGLDENNAALSLQFSGPEPPSKYPGTEKYSSATFRFGHQSMRANPSAEKIGQYATVWLRAARSGIAERVELVSPQGGSSGDTRDITITLDPSTPEAKAVELQHSDPELAAVDWVIHLPISAVQSHDYTSTPDPPTDAARAAWAEISAVVGKYYEASATTSPRGQAETSVDITVPESADSAQSVTRIAHGVPPLLPRFGHPTQLNLTIPDGNVELIVGGCMEHKPGHVRLPLELELAAQYEKC